jgi:hypothetical protein
MVSHAAQGQRLDRSVISGKILRNQAAYRENLAYIDAELSNNAAVFRRAACQLENLLKGEPAMVSEALSTIDMNRLLRLLADRHVTTRKLADCAKELERLPRAD